MAKKYIVTLPADERAELAALVRRRSATSTVVVRASILLAADTTGAALADEEIVRRYHVSLRTVERLRQRWCEQGLATAIHGRKRTVFKPKTFDGRVEAHLVALRCGAPPAGHAAWTLQLLADQMVTLGYVERISHESVRQLLKKTGSSPGANAPG